jgi:7-cyano-7-deazaguanine synthase
MIFDYGQSLIKEVNIARKNCENLNLNYIIVKIDLSYASSKCSLISSTQISCNRTLDQISNEIPSSYVEFRNGIFLSYAVMYAEVNKINNIYGGFNGLNSGNYYDDTIEFIKKFEAAANAGTSPGFNVSIHAPYSRLEKWQIVQKGLMIGVEYNKTWSCYLNQENQCGKCDSCKQRIYALDKAKKNARIQLPI